MIIRLAFALTLSNLSAHAADPARSAGEYPQRPVRIVSGFAAGGSTDFLMRVLAPRLNERLGQPFIIEHRPGAGGVIGANLVAKATPDGYTVLFIANSNMAGSRFLFKDLPFDTVTDFVPIALLSQTTFVTVVSPTSPVAEGSIRRSRSSCVPSRSPA